MMRFGSGRGGEYDMFVPAWMMSQKYAVLADWAAAFGTLLASGVALWVATIGNKREEWKQRRNDSILGAIIIGSLLEEVRTGHAIMVRIKKGINADSELVAQCLHGIARLRTSPGVTETQLGSVSGEIHKEDSTESVAASGAVIVPARQENESNRATNGDVLQLLPGASWEGAETIPSNVLLRIIATDSGCAADEVSARDVRVHCKNYFVHIRENVNAHILKMESGNWPLWEEGELQKLLANGPDGDDYIGATGKVIAILEAARESLKKNAAKKFPK